MSGKPKTDAAETLGALESPAARRAPPLVTPPPSDQFAAPGAVLCRYFKNRACDCSRCGACLEGA